jgi:uncharacterized protein YdaU (DUF1376 family)
VSKRDKADIWMPFYVDDYLGDTMHLTRDQHGAYMLLLIACWKAGGSLKNDAAHLASITKSTALEWKRLAPILKPFFQVRGKWLSHKRVVEELDKAARMLEARRLNGAKGGRPKNPKNPNQGFSQPPPRPNRENLEVLARKELAAPP